MAVPVTSPTDTLATSKATTITPSPAGEKVLYTVDEFIRQLGADEDQVPLLACTKLEQGRTICENFTGHDLDRFIDAAVKRFLHLGLPPVNEHVVVAIFALSNLDYLISLLALGRLGYATLLLSPRLSAAACATLLEETKSEILVYAPRMQATSDQIRQLRLVKQIPLLLRKDYDIPFTGPRFTRQVDGLVETWREIFILHSSGSTGLPKLLHYTHHKFLLALIHPLGQMPAFSSLPCFHTLGLAAPFMNWNNRKSIYLWDGTVPQTHESVATALELSRPEVVYTVPYILKLLAEKQRGVDLLKACKMVLFSGSGCPDELGDMLVSQGIHLGSLFGSTECGMLFSSLNRPRGDPTWNYLRPSPQVSPYLYMKPVEANIYECVVLDGYPSKMISNSDDPPNSFHSKDLFTLHPTIPGAWKFFGRLDDRVTLLNGEKVLPLPIEGRVRQDPLVKDAVVFGIARPIPGVLVFRADSAANLSDEELIDRIWPAVQDANSRAEGFSQISREMIRPLSANTDCPSTDKGSIKRAQVYREFASEIDLAYQELDNGDLELDVPGIESYIMTTFRDRLNINLASVETDFFAAGVDSLQAIQMRGLIRKTLRLGNKGSKLDPMVIFNYGSAANLARYLYAMQTGEVGVEQEDEIEVMSNLVKKYSVFDKHIPGLAPVSTTEQVVLTGATGGLGAHILAQLIDRDNVSKIYCLVRAVSSEAPVTRLVQNLREHGLKISPSFDIKVVALACDFSKGDLGMDAEMLETMKNEVSLIIHSAWSVNFTLGVKSFEQYHIKGLHHLLSLSLAVKTPNPARFFFCSSVSTALATPSTTKSIPEGPIQNLAYAANMGYARSKLIGEQIVHNAAFFAGARSRSLRIGQIVGDSKSGLWNDSDAIPLMIRSGLHLKCLPELEEPCSWLPVDTVAAAVLDLSGISDPSIPPRRDNDFSLIYNLVNPSTFSWTRDVLPALRNAGLEFETVSFATWLNRLQSSDLDQENEDAGRHHPYLKLLAFWERLWKDNEERKKKEEGKGWELRFEMGVTREDSVALRSNSPNVVEEGYIEKFVKVWLSSWRP